MAGKRTSQRSSRNKKPKYSFEEPEESSVDITPSLSSSMEMEAAAAKQVDIILKTLRADASVDITPSTSSSMEASAAKQVDIVLKTSGTERLSATSTCEKAVAPAGAAAEKSVRTIAINLTISEDQIRTWLDVPDTENSKKQTRKRATLSTPKASSRRAGKFTLTEKRKEFVLGKIAKDLSGANAAEFGNAESLEKLAKSIHVPQENMRKWLGITDDLSQIIANSNLKVRGFEPTRKVSVENEAEIETISLDDENLDEMVETQNDTELPVEAEEVTERPKELLEVEKQKGSECPEQTLEIPEGNECPEQTVETPEGNECPEQTVKIPEGNECPEQTVETPEGNECPEQTMEIPLDNECPEQTVEIPEDNECPEQTVETPEDNECPDQTVEIPEDNECPEQTVEIPEDNECPDQTVEIPEDNEYPEQTVEIPEDNGCPVQMVEIPEQTAEVQKGNESPEEIMEVPNEKGSLEELAEVLNENAEVPMDNEVPKEQVSQAEVTIQSPIPIDSLPMRDGEILKLVECEVFEDDDEASSSVGEIEMSNNDDLDGVPSSYESAEEAETCKVQLIGTNKIGNAEDVNPPEKEEAVGTVKSEVTFPDIPQQHQSSSLANRKSDEVDSGSIYPKIAEEAKVPPTPAKRKTRIDDYFPKLKNMKMA